MNASISLRITAKVWQQYLALDPLPQADRWLSGYFKQNKQHGKRDRRAISQYFFGALRHALYAVYCEYGDETLKHCKTPSEILKQLRSIPAERFFTHIEARLTSTKAAPDLIWHSIPPAFWPYLETRIQHSWDATQTQAFLTAQDQQPPLWIRLKNPSDLPEIRNQLAPLNLAIIEERRLSHTVALAIEGEKGLYELPAYQSGQVEIQDLGSQYIGDTISPEHKKSYVLDACAGGGGKTIQIAATLNNQGAIYATDIREHTLAEIKRRAKKGQFINIRALSWDWSKETPFVFSREIQNNQGFDWVLVDAPCSSSGTWRRNPDAKWRYDAAKLPELNKLQLSILTNASKTVKPNGHLVYATCSFLVEENEHIVEAFLKNHPEFTQIRHALLGCPTENSDTLFVAVLQKVR